MAKKKHPAGYDDLRGRFKSGFGSAPEPCKARFARFTGASVGCFACFARPSKACPRSPAGPTSLTGPVPPQGPVSGPGAAGYLQILWVGVGCGGGGCGVGGCGVGVPVVYTVTSWEAADGVPAAPPRATTANS